MIEAGASASTRRGARPCHFPRLYTVHETRQPHIHYTLPPAPRRVASRASKPVQFSTHSFAFIPFTAVYIVALGGPTGEMSSLGLRNCENGDCIVGSRARYKVYTGGTDPLRQSHVLPHTRATPHFTKRHGNVQPPLGARARGDAELRTDHRESAIDGYRSRRQRRRAHSEPVHASGQHFTRATLAALDS